MFTRRTATVTMSAPDSACAFAMTANDGYLPEPTIRRDWTGRPARPHGVSCTLPHPRRSPAARALAEFRSPVWNEVRAKRRAARLEAISRSIKEIGAPRRDTEDATAMLLSLAGADTCWPMHEEYGLPIERVPDTIANTVQLIVDQLKTKARQTR